VCGINGIWQREARWSERELLALAKRQSDAQRHRGPDDEGAWAEPESGVAFGHRRLSIIDLSPAGHQPMRSRSGRWLIAFNGEIYNHRDIRAEREKLGPVAWRGSSDTETLLAAVDAWGVRATIERCIGMFAIALWDRQERAVWLVRDRLGIKPLYYAATRDGVAFASELKAIRTLGTFDATVDDAAIAHFLRRGYVPSPATIHRHAWKLPPGTIAKLDAPRLSALQLETFWSPARVARAAVDAPFNGTEAEAVETLDALLRSAVKLRMLADVPIGAFLSGGIDSSTVVALMQAISDRPVKTFSIGNEVARFDESVNAESVARHLGTDHTALVVRPADALAIIPELPRMYDEPFADSSQIPTFLVSRLARSQVTVALSGDGGDELFGGYERHVWAESIHRAQRLAPAPARALAARLAHAIGPETWDTLLTPLTAGRVELPGRKLHKLADVFGAGTDGALYGALSGVWLEPPTRTPPPPPVGEPLATRPRDLRARVMLEDLRTYLPDDILVKVDRASMAVALEARVPLLDHRVVELAWRLPMSMKIRGTRSKWILREVLRRYVPDTLVDRPKMGFGVPIGAWLRGPLRPWAESLLEPGRLAREGHLDVARVRRTWSDLLAGRGAHEYRVWALLMLEAWLDANR
jgi:asparagine synthase (glutamine-hydrolysing)